MIRKFHTSSEKALHISKSADQYANKRAVYDKSVQKITFKCRSARVQYDIVLIFLAVSQYDTV
jgi:hypothetical protein